MEVVFHAGSTLLEGPIWDADNNLLYCVSIEQGIIYKVNPNIGKVDSFTTNGSVGCVALTTSQNLISAEKEGLYHIDVNTKIKKHITQLNPNIDLRYNDGRFDPVGRFLVGTKSEKDYFVEEKIPTGKLYSYYNGKSKVLLNDLLISNGIGFSSNGTKMYFIDTPTKKVAQYTYDLETGDISFDKHIVEIDGNGWPDGMCVDIDGNIWVAEWEGGRVRKWDINTGQAINEIELPCPRVTSCCLGGKNLDELFITTAKSKNNLLGGGLFKHKIR